MRTCCAARCISASPTPCPSWPMAQAQGQGSAALWISSPWWELVTIRGKPSASRSSDEADSTSCRPKCAPMPARSTFWLHSAAVPFRATTWLKPKAAALRRMEPTLPASCTRTQDGAHVACVLHAVQHHRGHAGTNDRRCLPVHQKTDARRGLQAADFGKQGICQHHALACALHPFQRHQRPEGFGHHGHGGLHATRQRGTAQMVPLQPDAPLLAVGPTILDKPAQILDQDVVTGLDQCGGGLSAHGGAFGQREQRATGAERNGKGAQADSSKACAPCAAAATRAAARGSAMRAMLTTWATGAKVRRCSSQAPCRRSAARWAAVP